MAIASQAISEVSAISADKLSNRLAMPYDPKKAPKPIDVVCKCGHHDKVSYDSTFSRERQVGEAVPATINPEQYTCSSCWWNEIGIKL